MDVAFFISVLVSDLGPVRPTTSSRPMKKRARGGTEEKIDD